MTKLEINSADGMQKLGASLAKTAQPHDLLLLNGDLGAGKTTMTQGLGRALGIHRPVKSPTFTIVREYREAKLPLFHMDFYRLENLAEPGLVVIEWPQLVMNDLPDEYLQLTITRVDDSWDSTKRVVEFTPHGKRNEEWVKAALTEFNK